SSPFQSADGVHLSEKLDRFFIVDQGNDFVQVFDLNKMKALFATGVDENTRGNLPADFHLSQNYPNPFNLAHAPTTRIEFNLPANMGSTRNLRLEIFDLLGRVVRSYSLSARGATAIEWDGKNENGVLVPAGVYEYRLTTGSVKSSRRLVVLH
ncbi:MAG: FlgD immunoglobulin-like domain containing protein, partial [bacterium]